MQKVILTAAITGGLHTPGMSPHLPYKPEDIIKEAVESYKAGAAVVHIHVRDPETGKPTSDLKLMRKVVKEIKERCNVVICITTGGAPGMSLEERVKAIPELKPELASCNSGSMNFVLSPIADKFESKFEWENEFLKSTEDFIFSNTYKSLKYYIKTMNKNNTRPEFEVYDVGMINNIAYFINKGLIEEPVYIQFVMGILGGIPANAKNLVHMVSTAEDLIDDFKWSTCAAGKSQFPMTATSLAMGGFARVGLEDNLYLRPRQLAKSNAEHVTQIKEIAERIGLKAATPDEAREILDLKGIEKVNY